MAVRDLRDWNEALAPLLALEEPTALLSALTKTLLRLRPAASNWLLAVFRPSGPPSLLGHFGGAATYDEHYAERPFMLDPFFTAYQQGREGLFPLAALAPDDFKRSEYFRTYYRHLKVGDEVGYLAALANGDSVHLSLGTLGTQRFSASDLAWFAAVEPTVALLLRRLASAPATPRAFADLGLDVLTDREREVATLMLQGHSAKSMARLLEIAPGTVRNHIKQVYAKLGVTSHRALFMKLLQRLGISAPV